MPTIPTGAESEVTFISGITNAARLSSSAFWTWNRDNPASFGPTNAAKWGSTTLSTTGTAGGTITYFFDAASGWTAAEQNEFASGLALWSAVANITFTVAASANSANLVFFRDAGSNSAYTSPIQVVPSTAGSGVDGHFVQTKIVIDTNPEYWRLGTSFDNAGGYGWQTVVHEEGHLIGLGHGGPYNGNVKSATQQFSAYDSRLWTLMSYIDPFDTTAKFYNTYPISGTSWGTNAAGWGYEPTTPMILDILAAQRIYGAPTSGPLATGGQVFGFNSNIAGLVHNFFDFSVNQHPVITIWDGGRNNTLDLSGFTAKSTVNLNAGSFSSVNGQVNNIAIAQDTTIETVITGIGNDTITGNSENNIINAGKGNDVIDGGAGTDTAVFSGARAGYTITTLSATSSRVTGPDGTDTVTNVERLQFADQTVTLSGTPPININPDVVYQKMYNTAPDSVVHNNLAQFANDQAAFAQQIGIPDPVIYADQALGVALAEQSGTGLTTFKTTWGPTAIASDTTFVTQAYASVFGHAGSAAQVAQFVSQVAFFKNLYTTSQAFGVDATRIDLLARGAVFGQMLGILAQSPGNALAPSSVQPDHTSTTTVFDLGDTSATAATTAANSSPNDDFGDSLTDSTHGFGVVTVGVSATGTLEVAEDRDWFRVELLAGNSYMIDLQGQTAGAGTLPDPYLRLYNNVGALVAANDDSVLGGTVDSEVFFTASTNGTFYIGAGAYNDSFTGSYKVLISLAPARPDDYANNLTDTSHPVGALSVGTSNTGTLEVPGDRDWYAVQLTAGTTYLIDLKGQTTDSGSLVDPYVRLHDSSGAIIAQNDDIVSGINTDSQMAFTASATGTYYVEVGAYNDLFSGTYQVSVKLATSVSDDFANALTDTSHPIGQLSVNSSTTASLETIGDRDWFRVQLTAGNTYAVDLQGHTSGSGTLPDPLLSLHDSTGAIIALNDDTLNGANVDSHLLYKIALTGTYYVEAAAYGDAFTGSYKVSVALAPTSADDFADFLSDASHPIGSVAANGTTTGTLEITSDRDWIGVQLTAGTTYVIDLQGQEDRVGTLADPFLRLHNSAGTIVAQNDDVSSGINSDSQLIYTTPTTGTYYIEAAAFADSYSGTYKVAVAPLSDDFANSPTDVSHPTGTIAVNASTIGQLQIAGDLDYFRAQLTAGVSYTINLQGQDTGAGTLVDPHLRLFDSSGAMLAENDDVSGHSLDSQITFTPAVSGTYVLEAAAYADSYSGTYRIGLSTSAGSAAAVSSADAPEPKGSEGVIDVSILGIKDDLSISHSAS